MPQRYKDNRAAWEELNPGWVCLDWSIGLPWMRNADLFHGCGVTWMPNRGDAKEASLVQVTQADIGAYELLWSLGGLYVNCDMRPVAALPDWFAQADLVLAWEIDDLLLSNAFMAARPRHPFLNAVIEALPHNALTATGGVDYATGPRFLTAMTERLRPSAAFLPAAACNPWLPGQAQNIYPETICVHEWGHATSDESLWPDKPRQPGAQRYS